jgi:hypothetical protein
MKVSVIFILIIAVLSSCSTCHTYYLDSRNGNDFNSGLSHDKAFMTLQKINNLKLYPGDKILIKRGTEYFGRLVIANSGTQGKPIYVGSYGEGNLPVIHGNGVVDATIFIHNASDIQITDIRVTNTGETRKPRRFGVWVDIENFGESRNICLSNLEIANVNGSLVKSQGGGSGIYWSNSGDSIMSRFVNLTIENCHIINCGRNAITSDGYTNRKKWNPSLGVVIRGNLIEGVPGDGIVPIGCDGALIEKNIMRSCPDSLSHEEAAAGIWPWSCDNTIIQYNEVTGHNAKWDGQGFDSDWNCQNTIIQYNYSHDNAGGFLLVCNKGDIIGGDYNIGTSHTVIKGNLSINDGIRNYPTERAGWFSPTIHLTGPCYGTVFEDNIILVPSKVNQKIDHTFLDVSNWGGPWPDSTTFRNNYFFTKDTLSFKFGDGKNFTFNKNSLRGIFISGDSVMSHSDIENRNELIKMLNNLNIYFPGISETILNQKIIQTSNPDGR